MLQNLQEKVNQQMQLCETTALVALFAAAVTPDATLQAGACHNADLSHTECARLATLHQLLTILAPDHPP
jgi:hypothetical protein